MARIGRNVTFDGSRETINRVLIKGIEKLNLVSGINWSFVNDNTINIYGEAADLTTLRNEAIARGFIFTINGAAPAEPTGIPDPIPTPDEIQALLEMKTAFDTAINNLIDSFWTDVETQYDLIKTTAEPFKRFTDLKWLRQRG